MAQAHRYRARQDAKRARQKATPAGWVRALAALARAIEGRRSGERTAQIKAADYELLPMLHSAGLVRMGDTLVTERGAREYARLRNLPNPLGGRKPRPGWAHTFPRDRPI